MKVYRDPVGIMKLKRPIYLTIGTFDGVHRGHLKVLKEVVHRAKKGRGISVAMTFKDHPRKSLGESRRPKLLTSTIHKLALLDRAGIDVCLLLDFTKKFAKQSPEAFVRKMLVGKMGVKAVHLGYRAHFGSKRLGTTETMRSLAQKYGFIFKETQAFTQGGIPLSSTLIRGLIQQGDLRDASRFLGRPFAILGTIVHGAGIGKKLGFPTANLDVRAELLPPKGVYAVTVNILRLRDWIVEHGSELDSRPEVTGLRGVLNLGTRPTIRGISHELVPEVHLLDYHRSLYGRILEVVFHQRLRDEIRFSSVPELQKQIALDLKTAKKRLVTER